MLRALSLLLTAAWLAGCSATVEEPTPAEAVVAAYQSPEGTVVVLSLLGPDGSRTGVPDVERLEDVRLTFLRNGSARETVRFDEVPAADAIAGARVNVTQTLFEGIEASATFILGDGRELRDLSWTRHVARPWYISPELSCSGGNLVWIAHIYVRKPGHEGTAYHAGGEGGSLRQLVHDVAEVERFEAVVTLPDGTTHRTTAFELDRELNAITSDLGRPAASRVEHDFRLRLVDGTLLDEEDFDVPLSGSTLRHDCAGPNP